jgi:hypothetical protein
LNSPGTGDDALIARDRSIIVRIAQFCAVFLFVFVVGSIGPFLILLGVLLSTGFILGGILLELGQAVPENVGDAILLGWSAICAIAGLFIGSVLAIKNDD